jgi:hypothetical protein
MDVDSIQDRGFEALHFPSGSDRCFQGDRDMMTTTVKIAGERQEHRGTFV